MVGAVVEEEKCGENWGDTVGEGREGNIWKGM